MKLRAVGLVVLAVGGCAYKVEPQNWTRVDAQAVSQRDLYECELQASSRGAVLLPGSRKPSSARFVVPGKRRVDGELFEKCMAAHGYVERQP